MKDLNRQKFEEDWRLAFQAAEVEPSSAVWANVEFDLVKNESDTMRKKVLFYKWLAAASVFLAFFLGSTYYITNRSGVRDITSRKDATQNSNLKNEDSSGKRNNDAGNQVAEAKDKTAASKKEVVKGDSRSGNRKIEVSNSVGMAGLREQEESNGFMSQSRHAAVNKPVKRVSPGSTDMTMSYLNVIEEAPAVVRSKIVMPRLVLPAMPAAFMASSKKNTSAEDLWASVGVSAGSYNPDYGRSSGGGLAYSSSQADMSNSSGYSDASNLGSAHSAGFAMSKRVFNKWVLQTGVNYVNQSTAYTSNYLATSAGNQSKVLVAEYADFMSQSVTITTPYQINSVVEVLSLPLQTGYLLVDRKIGWQLNTGVATDIFIRNTLTDASGNANRFSQGAGDNSPYRSVSWSGLFGTELSYKLAKQYRFSVVPSMRYSFNSVLKSASGQSSNPMVMDIGFRFRYIFK